MPQNNTYSIDLHNGISSAYNSYLIAGLSDLEATEEVELRYRHPKNKLPYVDINSQTWLSLRLPAQAQHKQSMHLTSKRSALLFFDLMDTPEISEAALTRCDIYFKRSFEPNRIARLSLEAQRKLLPMGIQFPCTSRQESVSSRLRAALITPKRQGTSAKNGSMVLRRLGGALLRRVADGNRVRSQPSYIDDLEYPPTHDANPHVYFRTRLFDPAKAATTEISEHLSELNRDRIALIEALKRTLGDHFSGGLYPTKATKKLRPDLIFDLPDGLSGQKGHFEMGRRSLIAINSLGVHGSTGWKFPECLAASRCLVNQRLPFINQVSAQADKHFLEFVDPQQCADICDNLLTDPQQIAEVRSTAYRFFCDEVRPVNALRFSLRAASERLRDNRGSHSG